MLTANLWKRSYRKYARLLSLLMAWCADSVRIKTVTISSSLLVNLIICSLSDSLAIKINVFSKYLITISGNWTAYTSGVSSLNLSIIYLLIVNIKCFSVDLSLLWLLKVFKNVFDCSSADMQTDILTPSD